MNYSVGSTLRVDGRLYNIVGKIQYQNMSDRCIWHEYRMFSADDRKEYWLSVDDVYREYSIWTVVPRMPYADDYHESDRGTEVVLGAWGNVDVDPGERAEFTEYEDSTEEKIISVEKWSDGKEYSTGYYLDEDEIELVSRGGGSQASQPSYSSPEFYSRDERRKSSGLAGLIAAVLTAIFLIPEFVPLLSALVVSGSTSISKYVKDHSSLYSYETSVTASNGLKADVYESHAGSAEMTAKNIIYGIDGNTEDVTENTEDGDGSISILTKKEYCLIYLSEEEDKVLVQISDRKYVYSSDSEPYHSTHHTRRFYRRSYYSRAYSRDNTRYGKKYTSSYSSFSDTTLGSSSGSSLSTYSSDIRQQSTARRSSSGGGTSYGK